jgi:DNA replication protein DnaC
MEAIKTAMWSKAMKERFATMPTDPQEATWTCNTCGTVEPQPYDVEGVIYYSQLKSCPCQEEERKRKEKEKLHKEWIDKEVKRTYGWLTPNWIETSLRKKTFENFKAERQSEAYDLAKMYASNPNGTLVLHGTFGTGKTHLLAAICNEALSKYGITSLFTTAPELFGAIQSRIGHNEEYLSLIESAGRARLFVIDDIDKAKWTEFREEVYFAIIDRRVKRELPTAISTNRLDDLGNFVGGAVCSRLQIGQIAIAMNGADYRKEL